MSSLIHSQWSWPHNKEVSDTAWRVAKALLLNHSNYYTNLKFLYSTDSLPLVQETEGNIIAWTINSIGFLNINHSTFIKMCCHKDWWIQSAHLQKLIQKSFERLSTSFLSTVTLYSWEYMAHYVSQWRYSKHFHN